MKTQFIRNSLLYSLGNFISKGIAVILIPFYTRVFDPADYGVLDWLTVITSLLAAFLTLQITSGVARYYADAKDNNYQKSVATSGLVFTAVVGLLPLFLVLPLGEFFSRITIGIENPTLIKIWYFSFLINLITQYFINLLKWKIEPVKQLSTSIITALVSILSTIFFVVFQEHGLIGVFEGKIIGSVVGVVLGAYYCRADLSIVKSNWTLLKEMVSYSSPIVLTAVGVLLMSITDRVMIKSFLNYESLGLYGIGFRLASVSQFFLVGVSQASLPLILKNYRDKETPSKIADLFLITTTAGLLLLSVASIFANEGLFVLTTEEYYQAYLFVPFLVTSNIFMGLLGFAPGINIRKKTKMLPKVYITAGIINVGLNYALMQYIGVLGVAIGTMVSSAFIFFLTLSISQKLYPIPYKFKELIYLTLAVSASIFVSFNLNFGNALNLVIRLILLSALLMFGFKLGLIKKTSTQTVLGIFIRKS